VQPGLLGNAKVKGGILSARKCLSEIGAIVRLANARSIATAGAIRRVLGCPSRKCYPANAFEISEFKKWLCQPGDRNVTTLRWGVENRWIVSSGF
jgi:hypothetical protein